LALDWLSNNPNLALFSEEKVIQRFALATFYFASGGDDWRNNELWLIEEDECIWYTSSTTRPQCDESGSYVNLELDLNDLSGTIPSELALLSNSLSRIDLSRAGSSSFISGSIPSELGYLTLLESIDLGGNQLSGSIPKQIGNWSQVDVLDFSNNLLSEELPSEIGLLSVLTELNLESNDLTGSLPTAIGRLTKMRSLFLGENQLDGPIPSEPFWKPRPNQLKERKLIQCN
jgi:hypothetical protein